MMRMEGASDAPAHVLTQGPELLRCLRKIGKGLLASGSPVELVQRVQEKHILPGVGLEHGINECIPIPGIGRMVEFYGQ